jgi:thioredoxin-dependent peroxiredoxin
MLLNVGDKAPDFTLPDANGNDVSLKDYSGRKLVLWFFPKANTPG